MGFNTIDRIAENLGIDINKEKFKGQIGEGLYNGKKVVLVKPQTFMNLSGECVQEVVNFYKIDVASELIVIYDDIDIDFGKIRIRPEGSSGTHNGMRSITDIMGTHDFMRVRIGIGKMEHGDMADFVLSSFTKEEKEVVNEITKEASEAVLKILDDGIDKAMNIYN